MKAFSTLVAVLFTLGASASNAELIVEKVDNQGLVPGNTYRVWAKLADPSWSLHIIWGDEQNPLHIETTTSFYQHPFGGYNNAALNEVVYGAEPSSRFDSWITLGYDSGEGNDLWDLGIDFGPFNQGGSIAATNGAWFLVPTDEKCVPNASGMVLIAQFTTTGIATGTLNLQGWSAPQNGWQELGLTFTTTKAEIFGCTDASAANYNAEATYDDGSCNGQSTPASGLSGGIAAMEEGSWDVFPNPVRENLIHIQFRNQLDLESDRTRIDIYDLSGKLINSFGVSADSILPGNRLTITQQLASGTYKVVLVQNDKAESKTLVVER